MEEAAEILVKPLSEVHVHAVVDDHQLRPMGPRDGANHEVARVRIHVQFVKPEDHVTKRLDADSTDLGLVVSLLFDLLHVADLDAVDVLHHHDALCAIGQEWLRHVHARVGGKKLSTVAEIIRLLSEVDLVLDSRSHLRDNPLHGTPKAGLQSTENEGKFARRVSSRIPHSASQCWYCEPRWGIGS